MPGNAINKQSVFTNKLCLHNNDLRLYGQYFEHFSGGVSDVILKAELPAVTMSNRKNHVNLQWWLYAV